MNIQNLLVIVEVKIGKGKFLECNKLFIEVICQLLHSTFYFKRDITVFTLSNQRGSHKLFSNEGQEENMLICAIFCQFNGEKSALMFFSNMSPMCLFSPFFLSSVLVTEK